ncbi:MAG: hypothetical protein IKQ83_04440 [Lachnospiraceae bacterium]|nr:hypothetical protein [Lachnospiraceae bacterium]
MATFLAVLKIIGIVLACILGALTAILLIVLFVPVRYSVKGRYKDDVYVKANVSYLLHLFALYATYTDAFKVILRILIIPIKLLPKKAGKKKKSKEKAEVKTESEAKTEDKKSETKAEEKSEAKAEDSGEGDKTGKPDKTEKAGADDKLELIKKYIDLLNEDSTKAAFEVCKVRIGKLIKAVLPRKIRINVTYGLNDPYVTAVIMSVYNVFYTYIGEGLNICPVYYEKTIEADGYIKGRIIAAPVLWQAIRVLLDKDCRKFLKRFKKING